MLHLLNMPSLTLASLFLLSGTAFACRRLSTPECSRCSVDSQSGFDWQQDQPTYTIVTPGTNTVTFQLLSVIRSRNSASNSSATSCSVLALNCSRSMVRDRNINLCQCLSAWSSQQPCTFYDRAACAQKWLLQVFGHIILTTSFYLPLPVTRKSQGHNLTPH